MVQPRTLLPVKPDLEGAWEKLDETSQTRHLGRLPRFLRGFRGSHEELVPLM